MSQTYKSTISFAHLDVFFLKTPIVKNISYQSAVSMRIELWSHGTAIQRHNHHTIRDLKLCRQKDNISIDRSRVTEAANNRLESV